MNWTEKMEQTVLSGVFIHFSDTKIDEFFSKNTCFDKFDGDIFGSGHAYLISVKNRRCEESPCDDEVRIELLESDTLEYLGEFEIIEDKTEPKHFSFISKLMEFRQICRKKQPVISERK